MTAGFILFDLTADFDPAAVSLMERLATNGWRFLKKAIVCDDMPGDRYVPTDAALFPRAWANALRAAPRNGGMVWMEMENIDDLKLTWGCDPRLPHRALLTLDLLHLRRRDQGVNARALVATAETFYDHLRPSHAYGLFNYDAHAMLPVGAGLTAIWDVNFLSSALVESVGRDRLRQIPAWRTVDLPDGGLLLDFAPNPVAEAAAYTQFYRHAAQALGISYHQGGQ